MKRTVLHSRRSRRQRDYQKRLLKQHVTRNIQETIPTTTVVVATDTPAVRGYGRGTDKYTPLTKTPKENTPQQKVQTPRPPPMRIQKSKRGERILKAIGSPVVEPLTIEINAAVTTSTACTLMEKQLQTYCTTLLPKTAPEVKRHSTTAWMNFMVIRSPSPYNGIIGRPGISAIRTVPSMAHGMLKFPVDGGIVTIYNTAAPPKECNTVTCDVTQTQRQYATKVTNLKVAIHPDSQSREYRSGVVVLIRTQVENPQRILPIKAEKTRAMLLERARGHSGEVPKLWSQTGKWSPYADTPSRLSWTIQGITKSKWPRNDDERQPSHKSCVYAIQRMPLGLNNAVPPTSDYTNVRRRETIPLDYKKQTKLHAAQAAYSTLPHASPHPTREELIYVLSRRMGRLRRATDR
ncbi:hypothetical protein Tco_0127379 [Tanacetum coccineum]